MQGEGGARACIEDHPMRSDITITTIARGARSRPPDLADRRGRFNPPAAGREGGRSAEADKATGARCFAWSMYWLVRAIPNDQYGVSLTNGNSVFYPRIPRRPRRNPFSSPGRAIGS